MKPVIVVHGGAGAWRLRGENLAIGAGACGDAGRRGQEVLLAGGSALDAVEAAVRVLEDCPALDAGRGSYLNRAGEIEMDAMIMDGDTLALGAVGAIQRVRNPISLARRVMTDSEHTFLVGAGASAFADQVGYPRCEHVDLIVAEELARLEESLDDADYRTDSIFSEPGAMGDTVGAVALDATGRLAAATSTGGTRNKLPGRVGDSPIVGSGAYADNWTAAVSATGHGEALMKVVISKRVCDFIGVGLSAQAACDAAIRLLAERVNGFGGLIAVDARGYVGVAYNTDAMPHAFAVGADPVVVRT